MATTPYRQLSFTLFPSISILLVVAAAHEFFHVSIPGLTRDSTAIAHIHPLAGALSNLGILLWCAAATMCFYSVLSLHDAKPRDSSRFLLFSGFLSTYLMFDDLFQFHEELAGRYLGVDENVVFAMLGIAITAYLITFRRIILRTKYCFLLLALGFLGTSAVIDVIFEPWLLKIGQWEFLFEDGSKWLGISCWCSYYACVSRKLLVKSFSPADETGL